MSAGTPQTDIAFFLATSGHSGVDRLMTNLTREIARRGYRIDLLQIRGHGPYIDPMPPGVRGIGLGCRHINGSLPSLVRYLNRERPSALLSDKDRLNRIALSACRLSRVNPRSAVRIGTTVSANLPNRSWYERRLQLASIRYLYPCAQSILVPSKGVAKDLIRLAGRPLPRLQVVPSPVVTPDFGRLCREPVDHPWFADCSRPLILGVGELSRRKDFATLIRAFHRLAPTSQARLMILGEGRERPRLEQMVADRNLQSRVALAGFTHNPYPFMARADVLVLSSVCEGLGLVLVEALAAGTPVVATDCPSGPRELLQEGVLGPLVAMGDPAALAAAIRQVLAAPPAQALLQSGAAAYHAAAAADRYLDALGFDSTRPIAASPWERNARMAGA